MWVYFITFSISLLLYYIISKSKIRPFKIQLLFNKSIILTKSNIACCSASIPLFLISGLRYAVGTDYFATYYTGFYRVLEDSSVDNFDLGFHGLIKGIQLFTDNAIWLFFIGSLIFIGLTMITIQDISVSPLYSVLLLLITRFYFIGMNVVKQAIALAIIVCSIKYIINQDKKKFVLTVLTASFFHYSSLVFLPVYFLGRIKLTFSKICIYILVDIGVFVIGIRYVLRLISHTKYGFLLNKFEVCGIKFMIFQVIINLLLFLVAYSNKQQKKDMVSRVFINLQFLALLIALTLRTIPLMERIYWIFTFPQIITIPYFMKLQKKTSRWILNSIVIGALFIFMIYDIGYVGDHD
ncbi:MAG TPA: EpsG family protein, partial [Candidatus Dorea intestinavium]|nr:EpsG family protein [Candidatus Dorea intestinavium]